MTRSIKLGLLGFVFAFACANPAGAQLEIQRRLAQIDSTFVCPESLPNDVARGDAVKLFLDQVTAVEPNLTLADLVSYRMTLLRKHNCTATLHNIGELGQALPPAQLSSPLTLVRNFYAALATADGYRASRLVVPEKRQFGPFSAPAITRFYSSLRDPVQLTAAYSASDGSVFVRYRFTFADGRICDGAGDVRTANRGSIRLIESIHAYTGC
jgi:hypothetical protein